LARALDAEQRASNLEQRLVDLQRAWPKDPRCVSATPDDDYPRRILESYLDVTTLSGDALGHGAGGQKLADILNQAQAERNRLLHEAVATLSRASLPVPMILHCPFCRRQHVDAPSEAEGWTNPPHKSHLCSGCGCIWRPADVPTVGVERIATRGQRDTRPLTAADEAATPLLCDALAPGPMNSTRYQCVYDRGHKGGHRYLRADFFRPPLTAAQIEAAAAYPYAHASRGMDMDMTLTPPVGNCKACGKRYPTVAEVREHRWGGLEGVCSARSPACAAALAKAWRAMKEQSSELSAEAAPTGEPTDPPIGRSADDARMALRRHVALRLQAEAGLTKERDDLKREETGNRDFTAGMEMVVAQIKGWQVGITDEAKDKLVALVKGMAYGDVKGWETMEEKVARLTRELGWREEDVRRFTKMHDAELKRADALEHRERLAIEQAAKLVNLPDDYLRRDMDEEHTAAHHPETVRALADGLLHARAELAAFEAGVRGDSDHYDRDDQAQAAAFLRGGNAVAGLRTELAAVRATLAEVREHAMSWFIAENAAGQPLYRDGKALYDGHATAIVQKIDKALRASPPVAPQGEEKEG
jgi:hypothetical protein